MVSHNYKNLKVWQKSRTLVKEVYMVSSTFPNEEKFGLISQLRRATISISLNIAEGSGRSTEKDFKSFLHNAYGSSLEVENVLILCNDLAFINEQLQNDLVAKVNEIQRMLNALITKTSSEKV